MTLRKVAGAAAFAALALSSTSSFALTEISWWHAMTDATAERLEKMAADFNASQSDYKVVPVFKGNYTETMTGAVAAFRAKKQPHIVQVFEVGTASMMAAKGAVYPVEQLMKDAGVEFDKSDYLPAVLSYYQSTSGQQLSLPFNSSSPVLWYNKEAFEKAGVEAVPATWNEMKSASEKLVAAGYKCGFSVGWQSWSLIENYSAWHNLPTGTKENGFAGFDTELTIANPAVINHIGELASWSKDNLFLYAGRRGDGLATFTNAECGMYINSSAYYGSIKAQAKFEFGQSMLPLDTTVADKPQNSIIGGATLWVLTGHETEEYKGVAKFLKFLSQPELQAWWSQETGYVPITKAAYALSEKQGFYEKNPGTDTAIKQLSLNEPTANSRGLRYGNFVQIRDVINEELEAIWSGTKTSEEGMKAAQERGNKLLRKFERVSGR